MEQVYITTYVAKFDIVIGDCYKIWFGFAFKDQIQQLQSNAIPIAMPNRNDILRMVFGYFLITGGLMLEMKVI